MQLPLLDGNGSRVSGWTALIHPLRVGAQEGAGPIAQVRDHRLVAIVHVDQGRQFKRNLLRLVSESRADLPIGLKNARKENVGLEFSK